MTRTTTRWTMFLSACLGSVCAAGAVLWHAKRPGSDGPPPLPDLSFLRETEEAADAGPSLEVSEREFLWDVEHHGNVLNAHGFRRLADALRDADNSALAGLFAPGFRGELPREPREICLRRDPVDVVRREDAGREPERVGAEGFLAHLLEHRRLFTGKPPAVQMALKTILPKVRKELDGPWEGLALLRLYGESPPGQPCEVTVILRYEVARPTTETLAGRGWFRAATVRQTLVARAAHYLLPDVARQRGLDPSLYHDNWLQDPDSPNSRRIASGGIFVCDFDRDGILDLLVTDINRYSLYRGRPDGRFEDVTAQAGLPRSPSNIHALSGVAAWIDIDGDGWEDLVLADRVFRNERGKFVDYTTRTHLPLPGDTISLVVADYDRDGRLDLYATRTGSGTARSWLSGRSGSDAGNRLFRNKGAWQFEDVTQTSGAGGGQRSTFTAVWFDADDDGWPDLYVTNEFGNGVLLVNRGDGTFQERALGGGPVDFGTMGAAAGDLDNDGRIDLYSANMYSKAGSRIIGNLPAEAYPDDMLARMRRFVAGSQVHLNKGGLKFEQAGERLQLNAVGWAYGPALADLDNDGWLDVFATAGQISRDRARPDG
jgi:hypothetical protein